MFKKNLDPSGRVLRFCFGLVLGGLSYKYSSITLLIGALFCVFESALSWCAVYQILGINRCRIKK